MRADQRHTKNPGSRLSAADLACKCKMKRDRRVLKSFSPALPSESAIYFAARAPARGLRVRAPLFIEVDVKVRLDSKCLGSWACCKRPNGQRLDPSVR
jgi:hypothetical protein